MIWNLIGTIGGKVLEIVDDVVEDKDEANKLKFQIQRQLIRNQWIVLQARGDNTKSAQRWRSVSLFGSNKLALMRMLKKKVINHQLSAKKALASVPDHFLDWRDQYLTPPG